LQHAVLEGVESANSYPIATSAAELLASIVRVMGANPSFLDRYQLIWEKCIPFINRWTVPSDVTSCYTLAESLLETYKADAIFVVNGIISMLPVTAGYRNEYCRANSYYLIGLLFDLFPNEMENDLIKYTSLLREGLNGIPGDVGMKRKNHR
jgi:hypothetical protein